jgi:hypothetical protein
MFLPTSAFKIEAVNKLVISGFVAVNATKRENSSFRRALYSVSFAFKFVTYNNSARVLIVSLYLLKMFKS